MKFTDAQQAAIDVRGKTLLVSAAAGSGKTFTLTQRILRSIIEEERDISRMLIVTFTRAAASELKAKISKTLSQAIAEHPESVHLQNQLLKLGSANICTIDSFFTTPVRANFEKLGLPSSIRLADDAELDPIRRKMMRESIEALLGNVTLESVRENAIGQLMTIISPARDSSGVIPALIDTYKRLVTSPEGINRLGRHAKRLSDSASKDFFETDEGCAILQEITSRVTFAIKSCEKALADFEEYTLIGDYYSGVFTSDLEKCKVLLTALDERNYQKAKDAFEALEFGKMPSVRKEVKNEDFEYYHKLRSKKIVPMLKSIKEELLCEEAAVISRHFERTGELCSSVYLLLSDYEKRYSAEKLKKGFCEFSDMPKYMLSLLTEPDGSPSEYCRSLREDFDEVYIDEYQDVNEIQDTIFALIGDKNRFMVGDIKQSIYGFREAEPSIFAEYRKRFPLYDKDDDSSISSEENTIFMSNNFRCDENVIKFTNTVCSKVFGAFADSIGYTSNDDLVFSKELPDENYVSPRVILNIIDSVEYSELENAVDVAIDDQEKNEATDKDKKEQKMLSDEACVVANEIARLIRQERKANGEPIFAKDIAVLVRSHKHAKPLMLALDMLGINYASSKGGDIFSEPDMMILIDLLTVVNNPRSDIPLCRLLTTSVAGVSPVISFDELVRIRQSVPETYSLYDAVIDYAENGEEKSLKQACTDFVSEIDKMRRLSSRLSAEKLLRILISLDRYTPLAESESYIYLFDCACSYVKRSWNGLGSFLSYLERLSESTTSSAERPGQKADAVTIMTMHQSKGLEFCACFLFGLGKQINHSDSKSPMLYSKEFGLSLKLPHEAQEDNDVFETIKERYSSSPLWQAADAVTRAKQIEEEARILYVALTRARERLYLNATLKRRFLSLMTDAVNCADLNYSIQKSKSYIETVMLTLAKLDLDNDVFKVNVYRKGEVDLTAGASFIGDSALLRSADSDDLELASLLTEGRMIDENELILSSLPSKVAASKVSPTMLDDSIFIAIPSSDNADDDYNEPQRENIESIKNRIALMRSQKVSFDSLLEVNKKPSASEKGTATHLFLQFCDYENVEKNGLDDEIARLLEKRFISERTAKIIDRAQLEGFFKSGLYALIHAAKNIRREFRFRLFRPASDFTQNEQTKALVAEKKIFVQGSIDLIIETKDDEIILCDYKTDKVSSDERADRDLLLSSIKERHGEQLKQYKFAIQRIFGREPSKIFVYLTAIGEAIEIS